VFEFEGNIGVFKHVLGFTAGVVTSFADDLGYPAVDDEHGAYAAGGHAAVKRRALQTDAELGGLTDGVLFGVDGADAVLGHGIVFVGDLLHLVTDFVAVRETHGRADVSRHEELAVAGDDAAASPSVTRCALCDGVGHFHEIVVPRGSFIRFTHRIAPF
jgi:hypothetical protein